MEKYFLAANSCEGFVSHFKGCYDAFSNWRVYIIKGGAGTGKSSFMKRLAKKAEALGFDVDICPCSSDPDSLDGVVIKEIKTAVLDGTAPHVVEPDYAGVCEQILNFGEFWDSEILMENGDEIIDTANRNKAFHKTAAAYLSAAGELLYDNLKLSKEFTDEKKAEMYALRLCKRYIPKKSNKKAKEQIRFIGGITPKGIIYYPETLKSNIKTFVVTEDRYGGVSSIISEKVKMYAQSVGYDVISYKSALLPSVLYDAVVIEELNLAFISESDYFKPDIDARRIHSRRFTDINAIKRTRARLSFNRKMAEKLIMGAEKSLKSAKSIHDQLESYYISSMDFEELNAFCDAKCDEILEG